MRDEDYEILLKYLRSILYDSRIIPLNIERLSEPYRELGAELQVLQRVVERMKICFELLTEGSFSELFYRMTEKAEEQVIPISGAQTSEQSVFAYIISDMAKEKEEKEKLESKAYRDSMTGIRNRLYLEETMERIQAKGLWFTLCYIDLDHLKQVNDEYGHRAGDAYICRFTELVSSRIRDYDLFARIGGDEFCLVFLECPMRVASQKMAWILEAFQKDETCPYVSGFSYGLVETEIGTETRTLDEILALADEKMYVMKRRHKETDGCKHV